MSITKLFACLLFLSITVSTTAQSSTEEPTGLPGDGFSLEGALALFKQSESPEDFEKQLNTESNYVNNLDLNEDGEIDFVSVTDRMDGDVHAIVLQAALSKAEVQDIAVIEIEKSGKDNATLQIVGDTDIYGEQLIIEPFDTDAKSIGKGPNATVSVSRIIVNVWAWPSVRYIYRPSYRVYVSPYRWGYYPTGWWRPWRPRTWVACHNYRVRLYRPMFRVTTTHRVVRAHRCYTPYRRTTKVVSTRTANVRVAHAKRGTVVQGNRVVKKSTTTKVVGKTNNGVYAGKKTTVKNSNANGKKVVGTKTTKGYAAKKKTSNKKAMNKGKKTSRQKKATAKRGRRG